MKEKESILKAFSGLLDGILGGSDKEQLESPVEVCKAVDTEKKQATFLAMMAYKDVTEFDLHEDTWEVDTIAKACHSFNIDCMKTNLGHLVMTDDSVATIVESYIAPVDMTLGDKYITKGSWLQVWQFADDSIWQGVKKGYWTGISPAFLAKYMELKDDSEES